MGQAAFIPLVVGSTLLKAGGSYYAGRAERKHAEAQAEHMRENARRIRRAGQMRAAEEGRKTARDVSDAAAIQAASGFSASDAAAIRDRAELAGVGKYNELAILYEHEQEARGMQRQASYTAARGRRIGRAGTIAAAASLLEGAAQASGPGAGGGGG